MAIDDILGKDIPKILKEFKKLENKIAPELAKIQANREHLPAELMTKFDEAMADIKAHKDKLKQYGINDFK
jgi:division protein CdvB (Snf7/Vps24/ESCRT-III family)